MAKESKKTSKELKKDAKEAKKNSKNKRHFWKDFKAELKKVVWLTPKQLFNNTAAVIAIVLLTAVIVVVLDLGFEAINKHGLNRLKESIENSTSQTENKTNEVEGNNVSTQEQSDNTSNTDTTAEQ